MTQKEFEAINALYKGVYTSIEEANSESPQDIFEALCWRFKFEEIAYGLQKGWYMHNWRRLKFSNGKIIFAQSDYGNDLKHERFIDFAELCRVMLIKRICPCCEQEMELGKFEGNMLSV